MPLLPPNQQRQSTEGTTTPTMQKTKNFYSQLICVTQHFTVKK